MNEHPILFTGEMVKAILDGRKTVTRRVIKPQPVFIEESFRWRWGKTGAVTASREWWNYMDSLDHCPYGQPGDLLWVRETWAAHPTLNRVQPKYLDCAEIYYRATCDNDSHYSWRPSIHMPRWASRITLEVTGVKGERLRGISEDDARAEGVTPSGVGADLAHLKYRAGFQTLWDTINAKRGHSWESNPWVWVVEFKQVQP